MKRFLLLVPTLALLACRADGPTEPAPVAAELAAASSDTLVAAPREAVTAPLRVRVTDARGRPMRDVPVAWSASDSGKVTPVQDRTGADGTVSATWVLGSRLGRQTVTAETRGPAGTLRASFTARATWGRPDRLQVVIERWMEPGDTASLQATAWYKNTFPTVNPAWTTSDPAVVTVDSLGRLTARGYGTATLTATYEGVSTSGPVHVLRRLRAASVSLSMSYRCALTAASETYCWYLQFDSTWAMAAAKAPFAARFARVEAGQEFACGLDAEGAAFCWGRNDRGQLGNGTTARASAPTRVAGGLRFREISAAGHAPCAITLEGALYCWGRNSTGQVGDGTTQDRLVPTRIAPGTAFSAVATSDLQACAVSTGGELYCWGNPTVLPERARPVPTRVGGPHRFTSVSLGWTTTCALATDGRVGCWEWGSEPGAADAQAGFLASDVRFTSVTAGHYSYCGLGRDAAVYCWGANDWGQLGNGTRESSATPVRIASTARFRSVVAGYQDACAVEESGEVLCWGFGGYSLGNIAGVAECSSGPRMGPFGPCRPTPRPVLVLPDR